MSEFDGHRQLETLLGRLSDAGLNEAVRELYELGNAEIKWRAVRRPLNTALSSAAYLFSIQRRGAGSDGAE